ncbi:Gmad2 immunoglobulin-like domain-containing protein [Cellulomonas sp. SG140]|uniref:Gmad2 immunoglobulin-like domain-containing protein n=1 Tax=Cellulomonas sp. SG140 TaxID=2976536 RepID=UPI0021E77675|nr:Gmad2 immunoglobulin-like domain-containing protein [Cellulomonas sp. SG140]
MSTLTRPSSFPLLAAGAMVALVGALLAGCQNQTAGPGASPSTVPAPTVTTSPPSPVPTPSLTPTPTPTPTPTVTTADVPIYFMIDTRTGLRLIPERHDLIGEPVRSAVERMIAGPDDPDYTSPWNKATRVLGVTPGNPTVVDLSADARTASIGSAGAALMIQQLVHTVTAATGDPSGSVLLTIAGQPAGELWGAVVWTAPQVREPALDVQAWVQIDAPRQGASTTSPVTVSGQAAVFEATLPWQVLGPTGAVVTSGVAHTAEGQTFAPYSFSVPLAPGTYTVVATEDDPSGGEAPGPRMSDSKTFTVH